MDKARLEQYPEALQGEKEVIDGLLEADLRQLRTVPVINLHETQRICAIAPSRCGLVTKTEFGRWSPHLRRVDIIEPKQEAKPKKTKKADVAEEEQSA